MRNVIAAAVIALAIIAAALLYGQSQEQDRLQQQRLYNLQHPPQGMKYVIPKK